jgi:Disulphide bond corrector protein DsbC
MSMRINSLALGLAFAATLAVVARSSAEPAPTVEWTALVRSHTVPVAGGTASVELSAAVAEGWHVYAATQLPGGPTPLRVTLEEGTGAKVTGKLSGTTPQKHHDTSFDLDTEFYTGAFTVHLPVVWRGVAVPESLPVDVRFQTCSDRECQPPKTIRLSAQLAGATQQ